jgi:hypothetical protein
VSQTCPYCNGGNAECSYCYGTWSYQPDEPTPQAASKRPTPKQHPERPAETRVAAKPSRSQIPTQKKETLSNHGKPRRVPDAVATFALATVERLVATQSNAPISCVVCKDTLPGTELAKHLERYELRPNSTRTYEDCARWLREMAIGRPSGLYLPCPWCSFVGDVVGHMRRAHNEKFPPRNSRASRAIQKAQAKLQIQRLRRRKPR